MPRIDNTSFYENAIKRHGQTAKGLNWNSKTSQYTRFEVLHEFLGDEILTCKMVDAGCGFGDFYLFLKQKGTLPRKYIGYDVVESVLSEAKKRTKQIFFKRDILSDALEEADYYVASGSMNILSRFETFLFIRRCFEASTKGFVFNLLKGEEEAFHFNYFLTHEIAEFVEDFGGEVLIRDDYMDGDFTVFLKKAKAC